MLSGAGISCFEISMSEASDAEAVERLQKCCKFNATEVLLCREHFAWQLQETSASAQFIIRSRRGAFEASTENR